MQVPRLLRDKGLDLVTLAEIYGVPADEEVRDTDWLEKAGTEGWVVFTKDWKIRSNRLEREMVSAHGVQMFGLSRQDLTADAMATRFVNNLRHITDACQTPVPFIYVVQESRIERVFPLGAS